MTRRSPRRGRRALPCVAALAALPLLASCPAAVRAQLPPPEERPAVAPRMPALSPDGTKLAFVWRGDVWVADAKTGGRAYPVTGHVEYDAYPVFSPDGKWLAFSSTRNGNWDIFVVPASGGEARQVTFSSGGEIATDWSPDGKKLIFSGKRDTDNNAVFAIDVATGRFTRLTEDYKGLGAATFSPDGSRIAFQRSGFPWTRPRYHGSGAAQLWTLDLAAGKRICLADDGRQHLWPVFLPGGKDVLTVTVGEETPNSRTVDKPLPPLKDSADRTPNLWAFPASGGKPRRLTSFVGGSVRCPAVARRTGDIVFEYGDSLYRLGAGEKEPVKLSLLCGGEDKQNNYQRQVFANSDAVESEISPDYKTFGFVVRGDLWTVPVEQDKKQRNADLATRLTDFAGFDRDFNWSKDGKRVFFVSDRAGSDGLFALDPAEPKKPAVPLWTGRGDVSGPVATPDGKSVAFWVRGSAGPAGARDVDGLYLVPADAKGEGQAKRLLALPGAVQGEFSFSPENRWVAFTRRGVESGGLNIYIAPVDGSAPPVNVTRLNAYHSMPTWSPDGRYLFFRSDRDGNALYALPLKPEDARADELEVKFEKPKQPLTKIEIDFEDAPLRIRKLTDRRPDADLTVSDEGQIFFVSDGDAWVASYDGKDVTKLTNGGNVGSLRPTKDGKAAYYRQNGALFKVDVANGAHPVTPIKFTAEWGRDVRAERSAAFNELWRAYNSRYYDPGFHGRDWAALRKRYEPLLAGVGTREEFAGVLNMMIGEIESSHAEVGAAPSPVRGPSTAQLGVYFDYGYEGPGIRVKSVPRRAPGWYEKTRIRPGEYIVAIDGQDVTLDENLYKTLNDRGDRDLVLLVNSKPGREGAHTVRYKALSGGEWSGIHYRNRVDRLRRTVEQRSGGRLAYVHIAGMGGDNQTQFERELYEYAEGKQGVIIDVRFNGGGNIADTLVSWLDTKPYATYVARNGFPSTPGRTWKKPVIVLMNEQSFSNAEMFPDFMRATGVAKLVGMPTPGYVIWTGGLPLIDGTSARMPGSGVYRADGTSMENKGEEPDFKVPLSNEDWLADRDPQLDKAISLLLK